MQAIVILRVRALSCFRLLPRPFLRVPHRRPLLRLHPRLGAPPLSPLLPCVWEARVHGRDGTIPPRLKQSTKLASAPHVPALQPHAHAIATGTADSTSRVSMLLSTRADASSPTTCCSGWLNGDDVDMGLKSGAMRCSGRLCAASAAGGQSFRVVLPSLPVQPATAALACHRPLSEGGASWTQQWLQYRPSPRSPHVC